MTITGQITRLPKLDLHCHLDGSLSPASIRLLARQCGVSLPKDDAELVRLLRAEDNCKSLAEYLRRFDLPLRCMSVAEAQYQAAYALVTEAAAEGVVYLELRFAPLLSVDNEAAGCAVVEQVLAGTREAAAKAGMDAAVILCCMRHFSEEQNRITLRLAERYLGQGVCALDLAGNEAAFPLARHRVIFEAAAGNGIPFTIHAGECGDVGEVAEAISLGARRIGHGIALRHAPELVAKAVRLGVTLELCPVSNLQTKAVSGWGDYPLSAFLQAGLPVTINTDNRTVSNTTVTRELTLLNEKLGVTMEGMLALTQNAIQAAFADTATKNRLSHLLRVFQRTHVDASPECPTS